MHEPVSHEARIPSRKFDEVRRAIRENRFTGRVQLRRVRSEGLWDLIAIVDCDNEADAALVTELGNAST